MSSDGFYLKTHLKSDVDQDYQDRVSQVEKEPNLNVLYLSSGGQLARDRDVDGGEHHHAGDVHGDHQLVAGRVLRVGDVGRCLGSIGFVLKTVKEYRNL